MCLVIVEKEFEHSCDPVTFRMPLLKKITITVTEVVLIQVSLALFSHVLVKPKFLLLTLTRQSFDVRRLHKILHELCTFLTRFSYTLFTKTLLLFCISLLKRFIYRTVNTSKILHSAAIPVTLTMK